MFLPRASVISLLSVTLAAAATAQPVPHTTTIPKLATGTYFGGASSFPLGRTGGRAQYWFRGSNVEIPSVVTAIGPRAASSASGAARTQSLEVTMANTALTHAQFTRDFAQNLGAQATVVYTRKMLSIPAVTANQGFDVPGVWIVLDAPFVFLGPNVVIDFDLGTAVGATSAAPFNGDLLTVSAAGRSWTSDPSCGGSLTASTSATSYSLALGGATPSAPAWFLLSFNATSLGGIPLPFMMDPIGIPGCLLSLDPQITVPVTTTAAGTANLSFSFPTPSEALAIYAQGIHLAATPAGLATTNLTRSIVGSAGFCSYIYNFTVDGALAQNGPNNWQGAMLLQP